MAGAEKRERETRKARWEGLEDDFAYDPNQLDREAAAPDQIRTVIKTFKEKLFSETSPAAPKCRRSSGKRILTDLVSLVRFAIHQDNEPIPFPERVKAKRGRG